LVFMRAEQKTPADREKSMREIQEDIAAKQLRQAYLLYGEESYLISQYRDKLKEELLDGADSMNLNCYGGKDVNIGQVIDMAETLPFFAPRRVILMENTSLFKSGGDALAEYLANPAETVFFIFTETELDKRSRLYKAADKLGRTVEFARQQDDILRRWVLGILKKENKQITAGTLQLFLEGTGNDMQNIHQELEKLLTYCADRDAITEDDVDKICTKQVSSQIFKMTDAIAAGNRNLAMKYYYDMTELQESPIYILTMVTRHFNLMLQAKDLLQKGADKQTLVSKMKIAPFQADMYIRQSRAFTLEYLKAALQDCAETDYRIKSGLSDMRMGVEMLLIRYSSKHH